MVAVPCETAVTKPELLTDATDGGLAVHPATVVTVPVLPSENVAEACSCCVVG